jgi:phospholipid/cholesterol/gamma-HCH transport system substrate-binding protein
MAQSEFINKRTFTLEFIVGLFTLVGVAVIAYLSVGLAGLQVGMKGQYEVKAKFSNISGLKYGSPVEIAGVQVGRVERISLDKHEAVITLRIDNSVTLYEDDVLSINTKGIIGDRYIRITPGASDVPIQPGGMITETVDAVDIEDVIGKVINKIGDSAK